MLTRFSRPFRMYLLVLCILSIASRGQQTLPLQATACTDNGQFSSLICSFGNSNCSALPPQHEDQTDLYGDGTRSVCVSDADLQVDFSTKTVDYTCKSSITVDSSCGNPSNGINQQINFNLVCDGSDPCDGSPIIIDTESEGFHLTAPSAGVTFDIAGTGNPVQMAWTDSHFHNAFLALPGADGLVHNGTDLFGNFTPQPKSEHPNGFIALAQYDKPEKGGNGDGIIDEHDQVFSQLRLWIDENHDGICQPNELHRLPELGVYSLALNYQESRRTDQFGNQFRYKARVNVGERKDSRDDRPHGENNEVGRWIYDVFFVIK